VLLELAGVEGPVGGDPVNRDQRPVDDDVGVPGLLRVPDRLAQLRGTGGQQSDGLAHISPGGGGADLEPGRQLGERLAFAQVRQEIGQEADYLAGAAVIVIGTWMLLAGDTDEEDKASRITSSRGLALIALGLSISLDELAIGFTIGLAHLRVTAVIVATALQAFIAAQLGLAIGARIGRALARARPCGNRSGQHFYRASPGQVIAAERIDR
jgi:hypothetical protein